MTTKVYFDESGYTGHDLLNQDQLFQSLSSVSIPEDEAKSLKQKYFPNIQSDELKYRQLSRRPSYHKNLILLQKELLDKHQGISYICNKKYLLILKLIDDCIEPAMYKFGINIYKGGFNISLASMIYFCGAPFWGEQNFNEILKSYQKCSKSKSEADFIILSDCIKNISGKQLSEYFTPLLNRDYHVKNEILSTLTTTDVSYPLVIGLVSQLEKRYENYEIIHDKTKNMEVFHRHMKELQTISSSKDFQLSSIANISFPIKLKSISESDSKHTVGIQMADLLAGGIVDIAYSLLNSKQSNDYTRELFKLYGDDNIIFQIPSTDFEEIQERFKESESFEFIEYVSKQIKRS